MPSKGTPTTILLVDDEPDMRMLARATVEVANHGLSIVGEASDGLQAIEAWQEVSRPSVPDVVVLDNRMPHLSGLDAAKRILAERPQQIIVLCSAFLTDDVRSEARAIGISACLSKDALSELPDVIWGLPAA